MHCPKCGSTNKVKAGFIKDAQHYKCKDCSCQFTRSEPKGFPFRVRLMAILLYTHGLSLNAIAKLVGASTFIIPLQSRGDDLSIGSAGTIKWTRNSHILLLRKFLTRLESLTIIHKSYFYFTDYYIAYNLEIQDELLYQSKGLTHGIERNNGQQRYMCARFRR